MHEDGGFRGLGETSSHEAEQAGSKPSVSLVVLPREPTTNPLTPKPV